MGPFGSPGPGPAPAVTNVPNSFVTWSGSPFPPQARTSPSGGSGPVRARPPSRVPGGESGIAADPSTGLDVPDAGHPRPRQLPSGTDHAHRGRAAMTAAFDWLWAAGSESLRGTGHSGGHRGLGFQFRPGEARHGRGFAIVIIALTDGEAEAFFAPRQQFTIWADGVVGHTISFEGLVGHGVISRRVSLPPPRADGDGVHGRAAGPACGHHLAAVGVPTASDRGQGLAV